MTDIFPMERRLRRLRTPDDVPQNPVEFARKVLGTSLYAKQEEMLRAVASRPLVSVSGANGTGKDFAAAIAAVWWLAVFPKSMVVVTAPTMRQVNDIVFAEMRAALERKRVTNPWGFQTYRKPYVVDPSDRKHHFAIGISVRDSVGGSGMSLGEGVFGYHSPNQLVIVSEAQGMDPSNFESISRLNPACVLMTGNPFSSQGVFYDSHHGESHRYYSIELSAFDTPNLEPGAPMRGYPQFPGMVTKMDVENRKNEWGEDNPLYQSGVLGEFPDRLDDAVVPKWVVERAVEQVVEPSGKVVVACDVARFGKDKTVATLRQGGRARILWKEQGRDTMHLAGRLGAYIRDHQVDFLVVDDAGVGGGVVDRLSEVGTGRTKLVAFNGGARARNPDLYANATSEAWMKMRDWFLGGEADVERDPDMMSQLWSRAYGYQSDRRIMLESKSKMNKSPDEADALAMTFAVQEVGFNIWV
ncbi:MAG: hypothetical protein IIC24_08725 [Chloroflexi bacterium]|nr:hypothetical protein [Chloroflexota bacterium]MCH8309316.1 hypothetical protein [Chloroflexota bacterium]